MMITNAKRVQSHSRGDLFKIFIERLRPSLSHSSHCLCAISQPDVALSASAAAVPRILPPLQGVVLAAHAALFLEPPLRDCAVAADKVEGRAMAFL